MASALSLGYATPLLPQIWQMQAQARADRTAVVCDDGSLSWSELIKRTNRFANGLLAMGLAPGTRIAIVMSNGIRTVETIIGTLRAGFVAVPLNLSVTDEAIRGMVVDSGAAVLVATDDQMVRAIMTPQLAVCIAVRKDDVALPRDWLDYDAWIVTQSDATPDVAIGPDTLANIIYSSGTTGVPKGIVHSHGGRTAWTYDLALALRYNSASRTLITTGLFSNISWAAMLPTLTLGGTLYVQGHFDARDFLETLERERITNTAMVPVQYQRVVEHPEFERFDRGSLKAAMSVGSKLPAWLKERLLAALPGACIELYGLTEGAATVLDPEDAAGRLDSVGLPIAGTEIAILRDDGTLAVAEEAGEVIGRSRFSMVGYWNRPEATAEATWTDGQGGKWLRTGDIGRLDRDGFLYVFDRKKDMILSGGQNVFPADIEAVLQAHPYVSECAVIGIPSDKWGETPLAVVVPREGCPQPDALQHWLNAQLGKQQRVSSLIFRTSLPRNPNGKLLKRELRAEFWR